ncbi:hypothetical protein RP75_03095 [Agrobacterium arsenijevicii]|uniref:Uncharacterized protein n=1 Tax=Agrobacterium arsenijevicii TaxID=1585697 RepID=A0ABR5DCZ7_9HYPH|nr:hypothetical protein RP75_03095 [Agrobacterium arsenijevicii]
MVLSSRERLLRFWLRCGILFSLQEIYDETGVVSTHIYFFYLPRHEISVILIGKFLGNRRFARIGLVRTADLDSRRRLKTRLCKAFPAFSLA